MKMRSGAIISMLILLVICGCNFMNEKPTPEPLPTPAPMPIPETTAQVFLSEWQQRNFAGMYALLTPQARTGMTVEQFAERYEKIYDGIEADHLVVTELPQESPTPSPQDTVANGIENVVRGFDYRVRMDTIAGVIEFEHHGRLRKTKDGNETKWLVEWNPSYIFPDMEDRDKVRVQSVKGERGEIVDRNGNELAANGTAMQLGIVPGQLGDSPESVKASIATKLGIDAKEMDRKLGASWVKPDLFVPIAIVAQGDIVKYRDIPGVAFQEKDIRVYPLGEAAAHLTGYIGEINADELEQRKEKGYETGDTIGKAGLEQVLEDKLRGTNGVVVTISDERGQRKAVIAEKAAVPGTSFQLTIDSDLQTMIYNEIKEDASSVSAIQPVTGEVLALLSSPSYDPNVFVRGISGERYDAWNNDPRHPFLNRFTKAYAPGSSFKIVTAAIGLDRKTLDPKEKKSITGLTWAKDGSWGNYFVKRVHAVNLVDLSKALIYSDNIYFAQAALQIGKTKFIEGAAKFGIGEAIPIAYPFSRSQIAKGDIQSDIQLADSGYGQGQVTMTSLHVALVFSALANGGNIAYPRLTLEDNADLPQTWKENAMSPDTAAMLKDDLVKAVSNPAGVGHGAYIPGASIAGKTGTAELKTSKSADGQENGWFVGFNAKDPQLLLSIMIEDVKGRGGSGYVTPKVKRIFQQVLKTLK
jgi:cell division protein FtsI/penicillin-binding protein 2